MKTSIVMPPFNQGPYIEDAIRSALQQDVPQLELIVIDGGSTDHTRDVLERHRDQLAVSFLGFRRDIPQLMQAADLFVFPSRYEACSLVLLKAAACGLPIVTARTTEGTELLTPGCSVLVENPEDEIELAETLNRPLESPARLRMMGEESRRVAVANSWQVMTGRCLRLYRELLQRAMREQSGDRRSSHAVT